LNLINKIQWLARRVTAQQRALANCQIVGAQKAGTSSLYYYLTQHPQVHGSLNKEVHYFDGGITPTRDTYKYGDAWYKAHFPLINKTTKNDIFVDATPMYLFNPLSAQRIQQFNQHSKIIILLRDPTQRAISHYFHSQRHGFEELDIMQALQAEEQRLETNNNPKALSFRVHSYKNRGLYLQQILAYQKLFPANQVLILDSDALFTTPNEALVEVYNFLEIDNGYQCPDLTIRNIGSNKNKVDDTVYQYLSNYFKEPNKQLFSSLNKTFNWL
jgi:hypothetical protein